MDKSYILVLFFTGREAANTTAVNGPKVKSRTRRRRIRKPESRLNQHGQLRAPSPGCSHQGA